MFVVVDGGKRLGDGLVVEGGEPDALRGACPSAVFEHLVHEELSFAVRVSGVHHGLGLFEESGDMGHLGLGFGGHLEFIGVGHDGQCFTFPFLECRVVVFGHVEFEEMSKAPSDDLVVLALDMVLLFFDDAQGPGDGAAQTGFFCDKKFHRFSSVFKPRYIHYSSS